MKKATLEAYLKNQELINELQKEQKLMREEIISQMKESVKSLSGYVAILTECERTSIDKKSLIKDHGQDFISNYTKVTSYKKLEIKKAA